MTQGNTPQPSGIDSAVHGDEMPHKPADDKEEVYFYGSPMLRGEVAKLAVHILIAIILVAMPYFLKKAWTTMPWWVWVVFSLIAIGVVGWPALMLRTIRYRISNYRIDFERGLFSKHIDTLELWHVEDIKFDQSLLDRMLSVGNITVFSNDDTTPKLVIQGIPRPRPVFESLKQRVIAVKRQRGVIKMDGGGVGDMDEHGHHHS